MSNDFSLYMDSSTHAAAIKLTISWLHNATNWNFGRFNSAINAEFYPLLKLPFPLPDEWDESRKAETRSCAKDRKGEIFRQALEQLAIGEDLEMARRAVRALPKGHMIKSANSKPNLNLSRLVPPVDPPEYPSISDSPPRKRVRIVGEPRFAAEHSGAPPSRSAVDILPVAAGGSNLSVRKTNGFPLLSSPSDNSDLVSSRDIDDTSDANPDSESNSEETPQPQPQAHVIDFSSKYHKNNNSNKNNDFRDNTISLTPPPVATQNNRRTVFPKCSICCRHILSALDCDRCCSHPGSRQVSEPPAALPPPSANEKITTASRDTSVLGPSPAGASLSPRQVDLDPRNAAESVLNSRGDPEDSVLGELRLQVKSLQQRVQEQDAQLKIQDERIKAQEDFSSTMKKALWYRRQMEKTLSTILPDEISLFQ